MAQPTVSVAVEHPLNPRMQNQQVVEDKPIACIVIGMAGAGKTTLMQRINSHVHERCIPSYTINLDPAVRTIPYTPNIDIRETVNYKEVMKQYKLGPNGGILTALNLFATRFDQVMDFAEKRADSLKYIFLDTPGQIEIFTWSASGAIITETLASSFRTVILYVVDTPRTHSPVTFMSNMTYACSIMYKTKLPLILVFNKTDVTSHSFATDWMSNYESFEAALESEKSYMSSLTKSMSLALDEFYKNIRSVGVSSLTGVGMDDLFAAISASGQEYTASYLPFLKSRIDAKEKKEKEKQNKSVDKLMKDMSSTRISNDGKGIILSQSKLPDVDDDEEDDGMADAADYYEHEFGDYGAEIPEDEDEDERKQYEDFMKYIHASKENLTGK